MLASVTPPALVGWLSSSWEASSFAWPFSSLALPSGHVALQLSCELVPRHIPLPSHSQSHTQDQVTSSVVEPLEMLGELVGQEVQLSMLAAQPEKS